MISCTSLLLTNFILLGTQNLQSENFAVQTIFLAQTFALDTPVLESATKPESHRVSGFLSSKGLQEKDDPHNI